MNAPFPTPQPDKVAILESLDAMFDLEDVIELRAFHKGKKRTDAGYFDGEHRQDLADAAARLNASGAAVYVTLNQLDPQLLGRYWNRVQDFAQDTATDANVIRRRWLLIDIDPVRPKNTAATEAQLGAAKEIATTCYRMLKAAGWPEPLAAESGNGWHLIYPLDLRNDDESRELVKGALTGLAARLDDDAAKVDQSVFNAGRITKLYGTVANKGDHTPIAPWRLSRLVSVPKRGEVVTPELLRSLHPAKREARDGSRPGSRDPGPFDLSGFLSRLGIDYDHDMHEGRNRYRLVHCPFNLEHGKGEAAIFQKPNGALGFKCQHNSCADKTWQDVRALVDGREREQKSKTNMALRMVNKTASAGTGHTAVEEPLLQVRCLADVQAVPIRWLWPGRIAKGKVTLIAGHPGLGKSQATLSMAAIVSIAGHWPLDRAHCERGSVLILSAEDDAGDTIKPRLQAAGADLSRIHIIDAVPNGYNAAGEVRLRAFNLSVDLTRLAELLERLGDVALIIIDPASAYLGKVESHSNAEVRALLAPVAALASKYGVAVVCVSHLSKASGPEALLRVQGSIAFSAAARAVWGVAKDKDDPSRRLFLPLKNNLGKDETGLAFSVEEVTLASGIETSRVLWEGAPVTVTAEEAFTPDMDQEERSAVAEVADWLQEILRDGDVESREVERLAKAQGFAWRTVHRARKKIGASIRRDGFGKGSRSLWSIRAKGPIRALHASPESVAPMEKLACMGEAEGDL